MHTARLCRPSFLISFPPRMVWRSRGRAIRTPLTRSKSDLRSRVGRGKTHPCDTDGRGHLTNWSDAPLTLRAPRFYRVLAETQPTPERGRLLTNSTVGQLSTNQVRSVMLDLGASGFVSPRFPVTLLRFTYETIDPFGLSIKASALLVFPQGVTEPFPLVGVQHGTTALKNIIPSQFSQSTSREVGIAFGTLGYLAVVADNLRLG